VEIIQNENENVIEFVEVTEIKVALMEIIKTIFSTITETNECFMENCFAKC